jgi:uncharacterized membrane protein (UPF0127 family)
MRARFLLAAVILVLVAGCGGEKEAVPVTVTFKQGSSNLVLRAEIAATPGQRAEGLMGRISLPEGAGMLFVFPAPVQVGFYMKDTLIPLDIAFISQDRVVEVRTMTPCTSNPCPVTTPAVVYERALEVNAGTFERAGISAGAGVAFGGAIPKGS